jgi:hypothetical protein
VLAAVALGGIGEAGRQPAGAAPDETPARKITRLRAKAARVQAAIERMNAQVEDYNEVREALARTRAGKARTRRQVLDARRRLRAARRQLGKRLWTIYTGGAPSTLGQLLGADSVHQALVTTKYQEQMVGADRAAVDRVERLRREVEALAAKLADQAERQERLQASLAAKRRQIEARLAAQRRYLKRLTRQVRRPVIQERRRQEQLRRRVGLGSLAPGDLVFFAHNTGDPGSIHHVGMYLGGGAMVEAPYSGARVRVASIGRGDYIGAVRPTG